MNKLQLCSVLASFFVAGGAIAQTPEASRATPPNTAPATNPAEGTAADNTPTGETQNTRDAMPPTNSATTGSKDTPADRTPPKDRARAGGLMHPELVGLQVVSPANAPIGKVVDVVFDSRGQPDYVVITSRGTNSAVPYRAANSMIERGKVIVDETRLRQAPKLEHGEWRNAADGGWKNEATRYWDQS